MTSDISLLVFLIDRIINAAAEVGACPLHSHEKYKALYEKLAESSHEESDMEPSDADSDDGGQVRQVDFTPLKDWELLLIKKFLRASQWSFNNQKK